MSRIIVKNLPIKATESDVKAHFNNKGVITDVKVLRKRDGSSRRFAFIGFKTEQEAEEAAKYFNLSFMNNSRLQVSLAKPLGDEELEKRKESLKRKRARDLPTNESKKAANEPEDAKLKEFLQVMQPQRATAMWKNDNADISKPTTVTANNNDDDEDVNDMTAVVKGDDKQESDQEDVDQEMAEPEDEKDEKKNDMEDEEEDWDPTAHLDEDEPKTANPEMTDEEWMRQRLTRIKENGEKPARELEREDEAAEAAEREAEREDEEVSEDVSDQSQATNRLFVRNLAFTVSRSDLQELFGQFGGLTQVHIPLDPKTDKPKGIAFVEYMDVSEATEAMNQLDGKPFQGRLMHLLYAQAQRNYQLDEFDIKQMPLKKQKALKRRMQASRHQFSWNSLYMNKDAVLEATAAKLKISKSELLDPHSSNMAVQQALAESSVLEGVQQYFKSKNIDLTKFEPGKAQELSDTVILAKNIPFGVSALEIQDMFAQYGKVVRTLMPPDGGIAIVQFKLPSDGRHAFKKLAFRRVGESILYLQKAPKGAVPDGEIAGETTPAEETASTTDGAASGTAKAALGTADILLPSEEHDDGADIRTSVFVKNLNFSTTQAAFVKHFQGVPGFISAIIKTKPDPKNAGKQLSMGFGFVEFRTLAQAQAAVKSLNDVPLDGHKLQLKISTRGQDAPVPKKKGSTKIVIKNVPFETSKQDLVELLGTFGHLRSVRLPRKFNRQTRGFAFAEFATPQEAEHALTSLRGAHLLGRRLVMDYAGEDAVDAEEEIARMEAKVSKQVSAVNVQGARLGGQQKGFDMEEE